ncbi:hypothetical protein ACTA71_002261 [Dictyostelium dimigraforme]
MKFKISIVVLYLIIYFTNIINGQNDITFSIYLDQCGSQINVGVDQCLLINSCGYRAMKVKEDDGISGSYTAYFYSSPDCSAFVPANLIMFDCPDDGFPGQYSIKCNTPGVTTHSSFANSVSSILTGVTSILSTVSSSTSSSATTSGSSSSIATLASSATSAVSSAVSSISSGSTSSGGSSSGGGGVVGATCNSEKSKSTIVVDYINETPYIQCNGSPDMVCGTQSLCTSLLPNQTVTCLANYHINCTGTSVECSIGGIEICELNWKNSSNSNSDSLTNFSISKLNNIFSIPNLFLIIISIILTISSINNFNII